MFVSYAEKTYLCTINFKKVRAKKIFLIKSNNKRI